MSLLRILFVDDEPHVLHGLENLLRKQRRRWDMVFASGGQQAMAEFDKAPFDVVVSDARMPGMDGATLLLKVKEEHPGVTRIVLSGHAEREAVLRALPVAHQFLSKPCDAELLRATVEHTCEMHALLHDETARDVIAGLDKVPSAAQTHREITGAAGRPDADAAEVTAIVRGDPAMSARLLQIVNSAYFGAAKRTTSVQQAVLHLGVDLLKTLALGAQLSVQADDPVAEGFSLTLLQDHSLRTARVAKRIVGDPGRAEEAFTAAIVHDIGTIVLALKLPDRFGRVVQWARETGQPFHVAETAVVGVTHAEMGAYLLGVWGLPRTIVNAVAFHHRPGLMTDGDREILAAVHVADALTDAAYVGAGNDEGRLDLDFLESAGLVAELPGWRAIATEEARRSARASA